ANAFCLADDLMEPFRPLIDREAIALIREGREQLDQSNKARLLALLTAECVMDDQSGPLMVQLHRMTASLVRCLSGEDRQLAIPKAGVFESTGEEPGQTPVSREEKHANTADFPSGG